MRSLHILPYLKGTLNLNLNPLMVCSAHITHHYEIGLGGSSMIMVHLRSLGSSASAAAACSIPSSLISVGRSGQAQSFLVSPNRSIVNGSSSVHWFSSQAASCQNQNHSRSQKAKLKEANESNALTQRPQGRREEGDVVLSVGEKVKENAKTATYGGVIVVGVAVMGALAYVILSELFSSASPNNVYTKTFKICKANHEVQDVLGTPIKCYGEETRKGWRRHVSHTEFFQGNTKVMRMKFYIEGQFRKGTVNLEKRKNESGKYEYSYVIVDVDGYPPRRIHVDAANL